MSLQYINFDGQIIAADLPVATMDNRALRYGDGLFETMLWKDGDIRFLDFHIERLQKGMQLLQFEENTKFDRFFIRSKVDELARKNNVIGQQLRVRFSVFRAGGGLYSPETNKPVFCIQLSQIPTSLRDKKMGLIIDLFTDVKKPFSDLSHVKSNNALIYVLAGVHKKKYAFDEVLILNQGGFLCEALTSNIFVYFEKTLYTPALSEACIDGVMRRVVMDMANDEGIPVVEAQIDPQIMKQADEIFCTNATQGVQWVMGYKQKRYFNKISRILQEKLINWNYNDE